MAFEPSVRQNLAKIVKEFGRMRCQENSFCRAALNDMAVGKYKKEINLIVLAIQENIPAEIASASESAPIETLVNRLTEKMVSNLGAEREGARWAVESWAIALGRQNAAAPKKAETSADEMVWGGEEKKSDTPPLIDKPLVTDKPPVVLKENVVIKKEDNLVVPPVVGSVGWLIAAWLAFLVSAFLSLGIGVTRITPDEVPEMIVMMVVMYGAVYVFSLLAGKTSAAKLLQGLLKILMGVTLIAVLIHSL